MKSFEYDRVYSNCPEEQCYNRADNYSDNDSSDDIIPYSDSLCHHPAVNLVTASK